MAFRADLKLMCLCLASLLMIPAGGQAEPLGRDVVMAQIGRGQQEFQAGQFEKAYTRFRWLLFNDTANPNRSDVYQNTLAAIRTENPLTFGVALTLLPSSNVQRSSSQETFHTDIGDFTIGDPEADKSGMGLRFDGSATVTHAYTPGRELSARLSLGTSIYTAKELISNSTSLWVTHSWLEPGALYSLSAFVSDTQYKDIDGRSSPDSRSKGISTSAAFALSDRNVVNLSLAVQNRDYHARNYMDGPVLNLRAAYKRRLTPQDTLSINMDLEASDTKSDPYAYKSIGLEAQYSHITQKGLVWDLSYKSILRDYEGTFVALPYAREDRVHDVTFGASYDKITVWDTVPRLSCTLRDHGSNVALYDYNAVDCALSFRRDF